MIKLAEEPHYMKWVKPLDNIVFQAWYRVLSFVSLHAPINEVFEAARHISENERGGTVYWVIPDRVARWDDLDVSPPYGLKMTVWIFGSALRRKNSVIARRGFWALYLWEPYVKRMARVLRTRSEGFTGEKVEEKG